VLRFASCSSFVAYPGVSEDAGDVEGFDPSFAEREAARWREARYAFDGTRYATARPDLCAEPP
jgi:hypothetical protein